MAKFVVRITKHPAFLSLPSRRRYEITVDDFCVLLHDLDDHKVTYTWPLPTIKSFKGLSQTNVSIVLSAIANGGPGEMVFLFLSPQEAHEFYSLMCHEVAQLKQAMSDGLYTGDYKHYPKDREQNDPLQNDPVFKYSASVASDSDSSESEEEPDHKGSYPTPPQTTYDHELFWERQPVPPVEDYDPRRQFGLVNESKHRYHPKGPEGVPQVRHERHIKDPRRDMHQRNPQHVHRGVIERQHENGHKNEHYEKRIIEGHRPQSPQFDHKGVEYVYDGRPSSPARFGIPGIKHNSHPLKPRSVSPHSDERLPHRIRHGQHSKPRSNSPHSDERRPYRTNPGPHPKPRSHSPSSDGRRQYGSRQNPHSKPRSNSPISEERYPARERQQDHRYIKPRKRQEKSIRMVNHAFRRLQLSDDTFQHTQRQELNDFTGTLRQKLKQIKDSRPVAQRPAGGYRERYIDTYDTGTVIRFRRSRQRDH